MALQALGNDGVIAYPTEAVFGLGCNPHSQVALQRILDIKGRKLDKGFILVAADQSQLNGFLAPIETPWQQQFDQHWPGPVTFVVPAATQFRNSLLSGYRNSLAVRVSDHPVVCKLCSNAGSALVSTSANRSGQPALRSAADVEAQFKDKIDAIVHAEVGDQAQPTSIYDVVSGKQLR